MKRSWRNSNDHFDEENMQHQILSNVRVCVMAICLHMVLHSLWHIKSGWHTQWNITQDQRRVKGARVGNKSVNISITDPKQTSLDSAVQCSVGCEAVIGERSGNVKWQDRQRSRGHYDAGVEGTGDRNRAVFCVLIVFCLCLGCDQWIFKHCRDRSTWCHNNSCHLHHVTKWIIPHHLNF